AAPGTGGASAPDFEAILRERHAGQRVLLAEDNPVNREVAEELLRAAGLIVESAWDGARAVELALTRGYDLALMDVQMPVMDGLEAARLIRQRSGLALPIVAMTANAFLEDREACLAAGMNDHVAKPIDPALLHTTLLRWLPLRDQPAAPEADAPQQLAQQTGLRERLAAVDGLDLDAALRFVAGQLPAALRVLRRFASTYREGLPELLDSNGDEHALILRWRTVCHSIRGALGAVGATALLGELVTLERMLDALDSRGAIAAQGATLHEGLIALVQRLDAALAT
ncbi:MAG TPA: response regulator, partial [Burkholderiaceae bacterium]